jgi:hypothetical protein
MSSALIQSLEKLFTANPAMVDENQASKEDYKLVKNCLTTSGNTVIEFIRALGYKVETDHFRILDWQFCRQTVMPVRISNENIVIVFNIEVERVYTVKPYPLLKPN